jgi:hypothetical protein
VSCMIDFTKEELQVIAESIPYILHESVEFRTQLLNKVNNMIGAYCYHTPSDAHYEQFRWQLCRKCGVQYK